MKFDAAFSKMRCKCKNSWRYSLLASIAVYNILENFTRLRYVIELLSIEYLTLFLKTSIVDIQ